MNFNIIMLLLVVIPISSAIWPDPYCEQGELRGQSCFLSSCTQFGGPGCRNPCCYQFIAQQPYCDEIEAGNSCKVRDPDPNCEFGVRVGPACFPSGCPQFGGSGCSSPCCWNSYEAGTRPSCNVAGPGCRMEICDGDLALDIVFLVDESSSIAIPNFETMNNFIAKLVEFDVNDKSTVSLIGFGSTNSFEQILDFTLTDNAGKISIINAVKNNPSHRGHTFTADALKKTLEIFASNNNQRPDILLLFTDGLYSGSISPCSIISDVDIGDVEIVIIGIGDNLDFNVIFGSDFNCLYNDASNDVFKIEEFTSDAFNAKQAEIRKKICRNTMISSAGLSIPISNDYDGIYYENKNNGDNNIIEIISLNILISIITCLIVIGFCTFLYYICFLNKIKINKPLPIYNKVSIVQKYDDDENVNLNKL